MSEKDFELSRREALAGLGGIGVASAGAGLGTTAYFSDQEEFENNTITAGKFGLTVDPGNHMIDQDEEEGSQHVKWPTKDSDAVVGGSINIIDAKPGDYFKFCWEVTVENNPGYVMVSAEGVEHFAGSETEADVSADDFDDVSELETLADNIYETAEIAVYEGTSYDVQIPFWDKSYDNFGKLLEALEGGLVLEDGNGNPLQIDEDEEGVTVCLYLEISTDIGNEIQGAETTWDLLFYGEQSRHNSDNTFQSDPPNGT